MPKQGISHDPHEPLPRELPPRRPAHVPRDTGQKPLAESPTHRANDQARSDGSLQMLSHGNGLAFFNSVFMLVVYTFVFSAIFKSRLDVGAEESKTQFAVVLFFGMIMLSLFKEIMNRVPGLILSNVNYIKKDAFQLVSSLTVLPEGWPSKAHTCAMWSKLSSSLPPC